VRETSSRSAAIASENGLASASFREDCVTRLSPSHRNYRLSGSVVATDYRCPCAEFVQRSGEEHFQMIAIAFRRVLSRVGAGWRVLGREQGLTDRGWQGKRPACGPAYVVGWVGDFVRRVMSPAGAFRNSSNTINASRAIHLRESRVLSRDVR
jgi:hypothetical protein